MRDGGMIGATGIVKITDVTWRVSKRIKQTNHAKIVDKNYIFNVKNNPLTQMDRSTIYVGIMRKYSIFWAKFYEKLSKTYIMTKSRRKFFLRQNLDVCGSYFQFLWFLRLTFEDIACQNYLFKKKWCFFGEEYKSV